MNHRLWTLTVNRICGISFPYVMAWKFKELKKAIAKAFRRIKKKERKKRTIRFVQCVRCPSGQEPFELLIKNTKVLIRRQSNGFSNSRFCRYLPIVFCLWNPDASPFIGIVIKQRNLQHREAIVLAIVGRPEHLPDHLLPLELLI